jgi:hypothetical protein
MKKYLNFLVGEKESILEQHRSAIKKTLLMEDEGILPDKTISGTGADKYDYKREKGKYYTKLKTATNWTDVTGKPYEKDIKEKIFKDTNVSTPKKDEKSTTKTIQVDPIKMDTKKVTTISTKKSKCPPMKLIGSDMTRALFKQKFEVGSDMTSFYLKDEYKLPDVVPGSTRLNCELEYINSRSQFDNKPFFILDYLHNLVAAFNEQHKLISWSASIAGKTSQPKKVDTYQDWCNLSGKATPGLKSPFKYIANKGCFDANNKRVKLRYDIPLVASQAAGIYKTHGFDPSYGQEEFGSKSGMIEIQTLWGEELGTGIHVPAIWAPGRKEAWTNVEKDTIQKGKITQDYIDKVTKTKEYDLSSGCFNVSPDFIGNKEVRRIAKLDAFIFILVESNENYLVKSGKDYFNELGGDDFCKNPAAIASQMGQNIRNA